MKLIVTGNSCVGKSAVVRQIAKELDLKVFDVDVWTAEQYKYNAPFRKFLKDTFESTDKAKIREAIQKDSRVLNQIMVQLKPYFKSSIKFFLDTHNSGIIDMAQLFECVDVQEMFGNIPVINVTASRASRLKMAQARNVDPETLKLFDRSQFAPEMKSALSDFTIVNEYSERNALFPYATILVQIVQQVRECAESFAKFHKDSWYTSQCSEDFNNLMFRVVAAYHENNRAYHNFNHIKFMLRHLMSWGYQHGHAVLGIPLFMATVMHDIVYDPKRGDNEKLSAIKAVDLLKKYYPAFDNTKRLEIASLVLSTAFNPSTGFRTETMREYLHDLDYAIFAESEQVVVEYDNLIKKEYAGVYPTVEEGLEVRIEILESLLEKPIYQSCRGRQWEQPARGNIMTLIDLNSDCLRWMRMNKIERSVV